MGHSPTQPAGSMTSVFAYARAVATGVAVLVVIGAWSRTAHAGGFDLEFWKPSSPTTGYFSEESARILARGTVDLATTLAYARQPLVIRNQTTGGTNGDVVKNRFSTFLTGAYGLANGIDVGLRVPAVIRQSGDVDVDLSDGTGTPGRPRASALGDIDLLVRMRFTEPAGGGGFRLTLTAPFGLPTGAPEALASSGAVSFRPRLILGWEANRWSTGVSAGFEFRRSVEIPSSNLVVGNAAAAGAGGAYAVLERRVWLLAEASVLLGTKLAGNGTSAVAAEALVGGRAMVAERILVQLGVGTGLTRAAGAARFRALLTVGYLWGGP